MKKYLFILLLLLVGLDCSFANTLNVLILRRAPQAEFSFHQNYALVSGRDFYGPISKDTQLQAEPFGNGLRVSVYDKQSGKKKVLTATQNEIYVVRSLGGAVSFEKEIGIDKLEKRMLPLTEPDLIRNAMQDGPFVSIRQPSYGGTITYEGPLTLFAKRGVNAVETVPVEKYVTQVVNCELGGEKSLQALKAQAVLVRTFALFIVQSRVKALQNGNKNWLYFQLFSTPIDQAYNCRKRVNDREPPSVLLKQAVKETTGEVVLRNGQLARVQYNTCASNKVAPGVICQEKMARMAHQGSEYKKILSTLLPGRVVGAYDMKALYRQTLSSLLQQQAHK